MRRKHPLWRGFWLACIWTALLTMLSGPDWLSPFHGSRQALTLALTTMAGAFLADLPGRLRHREKLPPPRAGKLLTAFLCGLAMTLACGMAGSGRILPSLLEGSAGACAFVAAAALSGFIAARIAGRRAAA